MRPSPQATSTQRTAPRASAAPERTLYLRDLDLIRRTVTENTRRLEAAVSDLVERKARACWTYSPEAHEAVLKALAAERRSIDVIDVEVL